MTTVDWSLAWRMAASVVLLALLTAALFAALVALGGALAFVVSGSVGFAAVGGLVVGVVGLVALAVAEYRQLRAVRRWEDAELVSSEEYPHLHALVARVATQLEVPTPEVALSTSEVPEAMVVGWRPGRTRLVLSYGTLGALDDEQLEAVVAHELAHVRNRDAALMTLLSLPAVLSEGLKARCENYLASLDEDDEPEGYTPPQYLRPNDTTDDEDEDDDFLDRLVCHFLVAVSTVTLLCSRAVIALVARERERRADRVAAAATGEPSVLADALRTLDRRIQSTPDRDLRAVDSASALSVLPLDPAVVDDVGLEHDDLAADGEGSPPLPDSRSSGIRFRTHPRTEDRIAELQVVARELETEFERGPGERRGS